MSRSLGDQIGKSVGISAKPQLSVYNLQNDKDLFVVAASDGLWEVMDNEEVVNFVEKYRHICKRTDVTEDVNIITPLNVCIAHLLCEEARYRWKYIVE
jgi:serine/threonine protein phosphatase PrpC